MQQGSINFTFKCSTISPGNSSIWGSKGQRLRVTSHKNSAGFFKLVYAYVYKSVCEWMTASWMACCCCRERLSEMREVYIREAELSPTSPAPTIDCVTSTDPFYDRFPWFRLVARFALLTAANIRPHSSSS